MVRIQGSGGARPSAPASWMAAVVGVGMIITVALFFVRPVMGVGFFFVLWIAAVALTVGYHVWNATSRHGVPTEQFDFRADTGPARPPAEDFPARLREVEKLRQDGLISEEEYRRKRAEVLNAPW